MENELKIPSKGAIDPASVFTTGQVISVEIETMEDRRLPKRLYFSIDTGKGMLNADVIYNEKTFLFLRNALLNKTELGIDISGQ